MEKEEKRTRDRALKKQLHLGGSSRIRRPKQSQRRKVIISRENSSRTALLEYWT